MSFEISGKIIEKYNTVQVNDRFKKREFVIEKTESNGGMEFTDHIKFQLTQDRCNLIDSVEINDEVKVNFNIRGNKWERDGKVNYFTNLDAWRIEKVQADQEGFAGTPPPSIDDLPPEPDEPDDLPF
ncbi:MAG: DUF3127 domain-containing protein [Bacteroidetes bacterium]|jgi:hypothetical protein|nr:DUF3127 domain-containing protein [Bacteroidota bacterium]